MLVNDFLQINAARLNDKVALVCNDHRLTYGEIDNMANRLANTLIGEGISRGSRVAICMDNSPEAVVAIFAVLKANAVFSAINPTTKADKLAFILDNEEASVLICDKMHWQTATAAASHAVSVRLIICAPEPPPAIGNYSARVLPWIEAIACGQSGQPPRQAIDVDLATIIYTSGTTGQPKGVMSTHLNMVTAATSIAEYLEHGPDDVILSVLPLAFGYGLYQLLVTFKTGGTLVLEKSFAFPYRAIELMIRENVTGFAGVPTVFAILLQLKDLQKHDIRSLRYLTNAGGAIPVAHIERLRQSFPQAKFYSMYGQTECTRVSYLPPEELDRRPDSVGKAIPNTEAYVIDESGNPVEPGDVGELVVRGAHVNRGYWHAPEETARVFRPGPVHGEAVLHTGDLFRVDSEGFLYFISRKDDIIKSRGQKVSPKEVENVLYSMDWVSEAAVIGVPDPLLGEAVKAVIVCNNRIVHNEHEVIAHCARHLEDFMVPKLVEFRHELPKNGSNKIDKKQLKLESRKIATAVRP